MGRHVSNYAGQASASCQTAGADPGGVARPDQATLPAGCVTSAGSCYPRGVVPLCTRGSGGLSAS